MVLQLLGVSIERPASEGGVFPAKGQGNSVSTSPFVWPGWKPQERRIMIDTTALRDSWQRQEITYKCNYRGYVTEFESEFGIGCVPGYCDNSSPLGGLLIRDSRELEW